MLKPEGGFYIMPDFSTLLSNKFKSSADFCKVLLDETGVALLPGSDFGFDSKKLIFRLSFVDFDGEKFLNYSYSKEELSDEDLNIYAPKIVKGINKIIDWANK